MLLSAEIPVYSGLELGDERINSLVSTQINENTRFALVGFPMDEGVRRNGGRPGARFAPDVIRSHFYRLIAPRNLKENQLCDLGNVDVKGLSLLKAQTRLGRVLSDLLKKGIFPIVLGGGHETAFGHFLGYALSKMEVSIINVDAHTDVRELKNGLGHSGSPFYQAMQHESGLLKAYHVIGAQKFAVSPAHLDRVLSKGSLQWREETPIIPITETATYLTLDLDVLDASTMPGVSALNASGLSIPEFDGLLQKLLENKKLSSLDVVELNPLVDQQGISAKRAAFILHRCLEVLTEKN